MKHIFLCGFMGSGKTTVGRLAAKFAGAAFLDLDDAIVKRAGRPIPEIFSKYGEGYFRELETAVLAESAFSPCSSVVATGGGALIRPENAGLCRKHGLVVFLDVPFDICYSRISNDSNRPIAAARSKEELVRLYEERSGLYRAHSDILLPDASLEERAGQIAKLLQKQNI